MPNRQKFVIKNYFSLNLKSLEAQKKQLKVNLAKVI